MIDNSFGFFQGTEMPNAGWWEALWPDPAGVLAKVGIKPGMDVIDSDSDRQPSKRDPALRANSGHPR
jgi:hypothetical protein